MSAYPMTCPHCGAEPAVVDRSGRPWFSCGSYGNFKSATCRDREPLYARVLKLEAQVARLVEAVTLAIRAYATAETKAETGPLMHDVLEDAIQRDKEAKP